MHLIPNEIWSLKLHSGKKIKSGFSSSKVSLKEKKSPDTTLVIVQYHS